MKYEGKATLDCPLFFQNKLRIIPEWCPKSRDIQQNRGFLIMKAQKQSTRWSQYRLFCEEKEGSDFAAQGRTD